MECIKCKITSGEPCLDCDGCKRYVHTECSDLNASELKVMALRGKRLLRFYCDDCLVGVRLVPQLIKQLDDLQKELDEIKVKVEAGPDSSIQEDMIIDEIYERQKRSNNVMIFNLPEESSSDLNATKELIKQVTNEDLNISKVSRIGKHNRNGVRALKVIFTCPEDANKVIRSKRDALKNEGIFVNGDLTPRQMDNWNKMKKEVEERKRNGEDDLVIRYKNGMPQIVVGGMRTKLLELQQAILCSVYDVIILVETWLTKDFSSMELGLRGFELFRLDRDETGSLKTRGGGILIAVRNCFSSNMIKIPVGNVEQLFISLSLGEDKYIMGGVYIPPSSGLDVYLEHTNIVDGILEGYPNHKLILRGDFNIPEATWDNDNFGVNVNCPENSPALAILNAFSYHNLYQVNSIPNSRNVFLDLIFCFSSIIVKEAIDVIFHNSIHHTAVNFDIRDKLEPVSSYTEYYYDFRNGDLFIFIYLAYGIHKRKG